MIDQYYASKLSAEKLKKCYDLATSRVVEYLEAEITHVLTHIEETDMVLELGCGYGRVLSRLAQAAQFVVGIDTSICSLELAKFLYQTKSKYHLFQMDAATLGFQDNTFNKTICIQNGISAFKTDPKKLMMESVRVTKNGGTCLFSSYSDAFWDYRLDWFVIQSREGLLGEIDWDETKEGNIVCKDGFKSTTFRKDDFLTLASLLELEAEIVEVDQSSVFCEIDVQK
ncbi:MAG: class I SAM-dependent methyltransferase [Candidatus Sifarchaeia archaeon]